MGIRRFLIACAVIFPILPGLALAASFPSARCTLSADKSRMIVLGMNAGAQSYSCLVECRLNVSGQRAFDVFKCNFALGANSAERQVCERTGNSPGHFTKITSSRYTCAPR